MSWRGAGVRNGVPAVALTGMDVRIGTTLDGVAAGFDTSSLRPLLLVSDTARGKTTVGRYLTRWWLADTARHAHVFAQAPSEWADLRVVPEHTDALSGPVGFGCPPRSCLVVVDGLDGAPEAGIAALIQGPAALILTSRGGPTLPEHPLFDRDPTCLGLVPPRPTDPGEAAVHEGQGRLDWPPSIVPVVPDLRGPLDFPCHRWHAPTDTWTVTR